MKKDLIVKFGSTLIAAVIAPCLGLAIFAGWYFREAAQTQKHVYDDYSEWRAFIPSKWSAGNRSDAAWAFLGGLVGVIANMALKTLLALGGGHA